MPELPEVESYARALHAHYSGKRLAGIRFYRDNIRFPLDKAMLRRIFEPESVLERIYRVGKLLTIETSRGVVTVSLGMSGSFSPTSATSPHAHEHLALLFRSGEVLGFIDPRRFGFWKVGEIYPPGIDPLDCNALQRFFKSKHCRSSSRSVKSLLVDQNRIAGIGNIYALEALHRAGLRPTRHPKNLSRSDWQRLATTLPRVLRAAIAAGGSSIATYRRLSGEEGKFQIRHRVYDRAGRRCLRRGCNGIITRIKQGGRSSWYCPRCQS